MATEMDVLSLNITGSSANATRAIDNLISRLKDLDNTFKTLSSSSTYANNLETAVHSITRVHNAIANINAQHIAEVAKAMKSLGNAGNTLAGFGNVSQTGKALDAVTLKAQNTAKSLANAFNIKDKEAIDSLTSSIKTMINTMGKGDAFYRAEDNVEQLIKDFGQFENKLYDVESTYDKVREILRSQPLYVPDNYTSNANWLSDIANIGIKNTTHDLGAGISAGQLANQLKSLIPALQGLYNESDIINTIAEYLRNNATPAMISFKDATEQSDEPFYRLDDAIRQTERSLGIIVPTLEQVNEFSRNVDLSGFNGQDFDGMMAAQTEAIQAWRDSLQTATSEIQNLSSAMQQTAPAAEPFDKIVSGLGQLDGITIGDFSNILPLAEGVNRLGYQSAVTASQTLPQIAEGLRSFDGITLPELGNMPDFSKGLRSMGGVAVQRAATALPFIADGLKQLKNVGDLPKMEGLNEFAKALSIFGRKTSETAVSNIPKLTQAFQQLFNTMSKAPRISQNTIDAANAMANLASRTGGVTRALNGANPKLSLWSSNAGRAAKSSFSLASAIGKVYATYWMLFRAFGMIGKAINIASDMTEVRNVVVQAFGDMAYKANEFANIAGESFGMSKLQALDAASRYQAMGKTMEITDAQVLKANTFLQEKLSDTLALKKVQQGYGDLGDTAADMSINLSKLAGDLASLYNVDIDVAAEKLNSIFTGTTKPLREFGFDLTQATLQEWALKNGIDANVKSMTQAQKAVLRYQYVMANASFVMGDFARTSESWHNSIVRLKLAFTNLGSVIGQGFINLLKPAVQRITAFVNTLTKLVEKAINAIGKLLGWQVQIDPVKPLGDGTGGGGSGLEDMEDAAKGAGKGAEDTADAMEDADKAADDTADNLDKAQKAAKKMKDYLLGIDELNVFRPDEETEDALKDKKNKDKKDKADKNKAGSGGGSGASSGGAGEGGATGGDVIFKPYKSLIDSWFELGKTIADTIGDALWNIDWKSIQNKAEKAASNLAQFLNGIFASKKLWTGIGHTIAEGLNTALSFLETFVDRFNWGQFGRRIGDMINQAVADFKWEKLGRTLAKYINAAFETLYNIGITFDAKKLGQGISDAINEFFEKLDVKWIARGLNIWVDKIKELVSTTLGNIKWKDIFKKLKELFSNLEPDTVIAFIGLALFGTRLGRAIGKKLGTLLLSGMKTELAKYGLKGKILNALKTALGASSASAAMGGALLGTLEVALLVKVSLMFAKDMKRRKELIDAYGYDEGRKQFANENQANPYKTTSKFSQNRAEQKPLDLFNFDFSLDLGNKAFNKFKEAFKADNFSDLGKNIVEGIGLGIAAAFSSLVEPIADLFTYIWDGICSVFGISSPAENMKPIGSDIFLGIVEGFKTKYSEFTKAVSDWYENHVKPWFTIEKWTTLGQNIKNGIESKWTEFKNNWAVRISEWWNTNVAPWFTLEKWQELGAKIKTGIINKWNEFKTEWGIKISEWWNTNVAPWFTIEKWTEIANHFKEAIKKKWDETVGQWKIDIANWWNTQVVPWFDINKWLTEAHHFKEAIKKKWDETVEQWKIDIANWWKDDVQKWFDINKWLTEATHIKEAIKKKWDEHVTQWRTDIKSWWDDDVKKWFSADEWAKLGKTAIDGLKKGFEEAWGHITQWLDDKINAVKEKISSLKQNAQEAETPSTQNSGETKKTKKTSKKASGGVFDDGRWRNVHAYAAGGVPDEGQLFWARESGAELVGTIGGNTAVMNNDQIVASVASGVQQAVTEALAPYLSDISTNTRITANKDFSVQIGDRQIAEANNRGQRQIGAAIFT